MACESCSRTLTLDEQDHLTIEERIAMGDRTAIYDVIVAGQEQLDAIRNQVSEHLAGDREIMDRLAAVRAARRTNGDPKERKETAAKDRCGKERQRNAVCGRNCPAIQGRRAGCGKRSPC